MSCIHHLYNTNYVNFYVFFELTESDMKQVLNFYLYCMSKIVFDVISLKSGLVWWYAFIKKCINKEPNMFKQTFERKVILDKVKLYMPRLFLYFYFV